MKLLFISNIIGKKIGSFSMASIIAAKELGFEYHMAANFNNSTPKQMRIDEDMYGIQLHHIDFVRNPLHPKNLIALIQLIKLIKVEQFDVIHCNTPVGGLLGRIAGRYCNVKKIIYQVHGFHFYSGGSKIKNELFKSIEKVLAHLTDLLITINNEDYEAASQFHLRKGGKVYVVHGVGINLDEYKNIDVDSKTKKSSLGLKDTDIVCISAGDLINRKNYKVAIDAIAHVNNPDLHYLICGEGPEKDNLINRAINAGIIDNIHFLGYRNDVKELLKIADFFLFTSLQEGLPRSLMEAMALGLPCVVSKIRGNIDLIDEGKGGFLCDPNDYLGFSEMINKIINCQDFGHYNKTKIKEYDINVVIQEIVSIYKTLL